MTNIPNPVMRRLRGYAFDPSLSTQVETALVNETIFKIPWEEKLTEGPVGEYLEIIDYDPASRLFYKPVNLNDSYILATDGLPPAEGNPMFHQQMVYAVAMTTIQNFERALGRHALWSSHKIKDEKGKTVAEKFVQRLRIYPHALREANAYYSPQKMALLFGYFPASTDTPDKFIPGGIVFTCLSHDIIAHETTHALLDGMFDRFVEANHPDTLAFHEAFADIVALFQHFTFPEVLRHQISKTRGDLASQNILGELAQEFGQAVGNYGALRDAIGSVNPETKQWELLKPDPEDYLRVTEPHGRGSILVATIFDAFLTIYKRRVADLLRIATSGTGVLPEGSIHPDLVNRLSDEAAKVAQQVLGMCIRALDYCPPTDITFGEYLRAIITADFDLVPDDPFNYRIAFIEAFRRRGIYPRDIRSLSTESLVWQKVTSEADQEIFVHLGDDNLTLLKEKVNSDEEYRLFTTDIGSTLRDYVHRMDYTKEREEIFQMTKDVQRILHELIKEKILKKTIRLESFEELTKLVLSTRNNPDVEGLRRDLNDDRFYRFEIESLRGARRVGPNGKIINQIIFSISQTREVVQEDETVVKFRGGCTLILDLENLRLRYVVSKPINDGQRLNRHRQYLQMSSGQSLRATYFGSNADAEPFALLHRGI